MNPLIASVDLKLNNCKFVLIHNSLSCDVSLTIMFDGLLTRTVLRCLVAHSNGRQALITPSHLGTSE